MRGLHWLILIASVCQAITVSSPVFADYADWEKWVDDEGKTNPSFSFVEMAAAQAQRFLCP